MSPSAPTTPPKPKTARFAWFFLLILLASLAGGGFIVGQQILAELNAQRDLLEQKLQAASQQSIVLQQQLDALKQQGAALEPRVQALQRGQAGLQEAVTAMHARQAQGRDQEWSAAEILYLLNVAQQRLILAQDVDAAVAALQAADKRLMQSGDPGFLPLREVLAKDINQLRAVEQPDVAGMALRLTDYADRAGELPLLQGITPTQAARRQDIPPAEPTAPPGWQDWTAVFWREIKQLIVIRRNSDAQAGLLTPEQRDLLAANLRLKLESARFALLRRDETQFRKELSILLHWMARYYDDNAQPVHAMSSDLQAMHSQPLRAPLPDLGRTAAALRSHLQTMANAQPIAAPENPPEPPTTELQ